MSRARPTRRRPGVPVDAPADGRLLRQVLAAVEADGLATVDALAHRLGVDRGAIVAARLQLERLGRLPPAAAAGTGVGFAAGAGCGGCHGCTPTARPEGPGSGVGCPDSATTCDDSRPLGAEGAADR